MKYGVLLLCLCPVSSESTSESVAATATVLRQPMLRLAEFGTDFTKKADVEHRHSWEFPMVRVTSIFHLLSFRFLLKAGALCSSVLMTLSPLRTINEIKKTQSTKKYPPYAFVMIFFVAAQWEFYGFFAYFVTKNSGFLILVYSNALGVVMGFFYSIQYYKNTHDSKRESQFWNVVQCALLVFASEMVVISEQAHPKALLIVGTCAAVMSVLVSGAPLADLPQIVQKRCADSIPWDIVIACIIASALWLACAIMLNDLWMMIPNVFGLVLGFLQAGIKVHFKGKGDPKAAAPSYGTIDLEGHKSTETAQIILGGTGGTF